MMLTDRLEKKLNGQCEPKLICDAMSEAIQLAKS